MNYLPVMGGKYTLNLNQITYVTWEPSVPGAMVHLSGARKFYLGDDDFYALADKLGYKPTEAPAEPRIISAEEALRYTLGISEDEEPEDTLIA